MEISSATAFSAGLASIQSGQRRADQAASEVAASTLPTASNAQATAPDLTSLLLELEMGKQQVEAGAKVVKTADETLGTLINTRA